MSLLWPILMQAIQQPATTAIVDDFRTYTYRDLVGGSMFVAEAIDKISGQTNVGILLPTGGAFAMSFIGLWMAQRVPVPLNYLLTPNELTGVVLDSQIDTIITVGPMLDHLGGGKFLPPHIKLLRLDQMDFTVAPPLRWPPVFSDDELAVLLYTSGTASKPKGVMLTHGNLTEDVRASIEHARFIKNDVLLGVIPQFHSYGLTGLTLIPLVVGAKVVYSARFVPKKIIELLQTHRPTVMMAVPSMYNALLSVKDAKADDFRSLRFAISGGEALPDVVFEQYLNRFNLQLLEGYGLTETSPVVTWLTPWKFRRHAVGSALPGVSILIIDEQNRALPPGSSADGEVLLAGSMIMKGYYRQPRITDNVITIRKGFDGVQRRYFRTGDLGRLDADGFLFITGRKKELFKVAGEMVSPREIEEVLVKHPTIKSAAVVPKPDGMRGLVPVAFVEHHVDGQRVDEMEVRSWCRDKLAGYKVPREIRTMTALPRNPAGKILRRELKVD